MAAEGFPDSVVATSAGKALVTRRWSIFFVSVSVAGERPHAQRVFYDVMVKDIYPDDLHDLLLRRLRAWLPQERLRHEFRVDEVDLKRLVLRPGFQPRSIFWPG